MFNLNNYLEKFKKISPPDDYIKRKTIEIIKEEIGVDLDRKDIRYINKNIYIYAKPIIKSEIFLKKDFILSKIKKQSKNKIILDIK